MVTPIRAVQTGAARIGAGALDHRIAIRTGDELEVLANQFNSMAAQLQESYANLEQKVEDRTRDLTEALEQQTATSEILGVISSSPTDIQPVLEAVAENAARLCEAQDVVIMRVHGEALRRVAGVGEFLKLLPADFTIPITRGSVAARAVVDRTTVHVHDLAAEPEDEFPVGRELQRRFGHHTMLAVPLLREGAPIGVIVVIRMEIRPFTDKQIDLVATFADQAVIAIENVRLFQELQVRNRDLTEALEQQTATAEILRAISASPTDVQPVFEIIAERAVNLSGGEVSAVSRFDGELIQLVAIHGMTPEGVEAVRRSFPQRSSAESVTARTIRKRAVVHIPDVLADPDYQYKDTALAVRYRGALGVPMLREGQVIGAVFVARAMAGHFGDRQVALLKTFADQAVIAIENVRLFQELQARTRELARSVDELKALGEISQAVSSTLDLQTVLTTIVTRAVQISGTSGGAIYEYDETTQEFHLRATHGIEAELIDARRAAPIRLGEGAVGKAATTRAPVQVPDILDEHVAVASRVRPIAVRLGYRSLLAVPLLFEERIVGGLFVSRKEPGSFSPEVVNLLQTFAAQSVLAIQNARLFRELAEKGRELELASRHKSQFLANMSHELRTPLNAILGYTELILDNIYGEVAPRIREVLERLHKSGHHLLGLINDVLDLSKIEAGQLTLALADYSLPQVVQTVVTAMEALAAEKHLALKVHLPPDLPPGRGDERRLTQVLLNLVGNAIKFTEAGEVRVEVTAGDGVFRVAVADTGPGIAAADQAKIFEEFQQAAGPGAPRKGGTGLGLAIAKRIIALHGGQIGVSSRLGQGSTFWFTLPVRVERPGEGQ
jgi:signal transduction histidine kinase